MSAVSITTEGSGYVLTCECQWTRWERTRMEADAAQVLHAKKCKGPKSKPDPKPARRAASVSWDDREGATWIDQL